MADAGLRNFTDLSSVFDSDSITKKDYLLKKHFIFILMTLFLSLNAAEVPKWFVEDPDDRGIYFRGVSTWFVTDDARMSDLSKKDAMRNAFAEISDYFGVNIQSNFESTIEVTNNSSNVSAVSNIKSKSNQLLFNLKPKANYIEYNDDETNFRTYVLVLLDEDTENKIHKEMEQDEQEFLELKQKILTLIDNQKYFKAKNILEQAKGKRSVYMDNTLEQIESRLQKLMQGFLVAKININKNVYAPDENIHLEISLNQKGYLYLFYETGSDVEMIYPNLFQPSPYIQKEQMISFPNEDKELYLTAYEEDLNQEVSFIAIASQINLPLKKYSVEKTDGIYLYEKSGEYRQMIIRCIEEGKCTKTVIPFNISNDLDTPIRLQFYTEKSLLPKIRKFFQSKGVKSKISDVSISFNIKKNIKYSKLLDMRIPNYHITGKLHKNSNRVKQITHECSENELYESLYDLYVKLINDV